MATDSATGPADISANLARVRARVATAAAVSGRQGADVRLLAAVKYVDPAACAQLVAAGVLDLAENRVAALDAKQEAAPDASWHFIGRLQSREASGLADRVQLIHSLCTDSAAARLARAAQERTSPLRVLVQVNVGEDPSKDGLAPRDVERWLDTLPREIEVAGFMTMPSFVEDPEASRGAFAALRRLRDALAPRVVGRHDLALLSMGTSQDYAVAVEEGATHVRLGRILFTDGE